MKLLATVVVFALVLVVVTGCGADGGGGDGEVEAASAPVELRFAVKGMTCQGCADFVQKKMSTIEGVQACAVSLDDARATVLTQSPTTAQAVLAEFDDGGYTLTLAD